MKEPYIAIGYNEKGEMDFSIWLTIRNLTLEEMNDLRRMIPVAIASAENQFKMGEQKRMELPSREVEDDHKA